MYIYSFDTILKHPNHSTDYSLTWRQWVLPHGFVMDRHLSLFLKHKPSHVSLPQATKKRTCSFDDPKLGVFFSTPTTYPGKCRSPWEPFSLGYRWLDNGGIRLHTQKKQIQKYFYERSVTNCKPWISAGWLLRGNTQDKRKIGLSLTRARVDTALFCLQEFLRRM